MEGIEDQNMNGDEREGPELSEKLTEDWQKMSQKLNLQFINESRKRDVKSDKGPAILTFFHNRLDINRYFIEDSDGKVGSAQPSGQSNIGGGGMPQIESGGGQQDAANAQEFEDVLNDALCVYVTGDSNQEILEKNKHLIMFYIDLENEEIINAPEKAEEQKQNDDEPQGDMGQESKHPVLFNQYPLCQNHTLFLLFPDAGLPQILSDELLLLMLQIFKVNEKESLRIGYNSMGADSIANNLHFHLLYADELFKDFNVGKNEQSPDEVCFPIEQATKKLFFRTTLQHKNKEEINMYNCPVRFGELGEDWPVRCLLLSPDIGEEQADTGLEDAQEALAHTAGIVLNYLIDQNIPHNLLIADDGMTLYVIPRKFDLLIERVAFKTSFESLCGFVQFKNKEAFDKDPDHAGIFDSMKQNVSVSEEDFGRFKTELVAKFMQEYEGSLIQ